MMQLSSVIAMITVALAIGFSRAGDTQGTKDRATVGTEESPSRGIVVLVYHRITEAGGQADDERVPLDIFAKQMRLLSDAGYTSLSLAQLNGILLGIERMPSKAVAIHFDDGWKSVQKALPVLKKYGLNASFMIITGAAQGDYGDDYLTWGDIAKIDEDPLFDTGSHTVTHPWKEDHNLVLWSETIQNPLSAMRIDHELRESKLELEASLGRPIKALAWPMGWHNKLLDELAAGAGYDLLLTYQCKPNHPAPSATKRVYRCGVDGAKSMSSFKSLIGGQKS